MWEVLYHWFLVTFTLRYGLFLLAVIVAYFDIDVWLKSKFVLAKNTLKRFN